MERRYPGRPLVLGGFSFGAAIAILVGQRDEAVKAMVALGYPFRLLPGASTGAERTAPRLFVQGEKDEFGGDAQIRAHVAALPEPKRLVVIPGSDHYFTGHLEALQQAIEEWAAARPWAKA
jgi:alpha/beta superfamily hydrolase